MKIRTITCFYNPANPDAPQQLQKLGELAKTATRRFTEAGYTVQTTRLATVPFPLALKAQTKDAAVEYAADLQARALQNGFHWAMMGPALLSHPESYEWVQPMLAATRIVSFSAEVANREQGVSLAAARACGKIIARAATVTVDGFTNLRFAALANVKPFSVFFPAAYAQGDQLAFGIGVESADLVLAILKESHTLAAARKRLLQAFETQGKRLAAIAEELGQNFEIEFKGLDFSAVPFPQAWCSVGAALEQLGPTHLGQSGSLAAAAFLADVLEQGRWPRTGMNGLTLPVLEDSTLADLGGSTLSIKDLLLFASVAGNGVDAVPLPGSATPEQLAAVIMDVAFLSARLKRPLLARLMPIPGKLAGDPVHIHFDYFAPGRVLDLPAAPLRGPLAGSEALRFD